MKSYHLKQHGGDLEDTKLTEICQNKKDKHCVISVMFGIWNTDEET